MAKAKPDKESAKQVDKVVSEHAKVKKKLEEVVKQGAEIEKALKKVKDGQMEMTELQQLFQQHQKMLDMTSNIMKKQHDNAMKTISNMKG